MHVEKGDRHKMNKVADKKRENRLRKQVKKANPQKDKRFKLVDKGDDKKKKEE